MKNEILSLDPPPLLYSPVLDACSSNRDAALQSWHITSFSGVLDASSFYKDAVFQKALLPGGLWTKLDFFLFF